MAETLVDRVIERHRRRLHGRARRIAIVRPEIFNRIACRSPCKPLEFLSAPSLIVLLTVNVSPIRENISASNGDHPILEQGITSVELPGK
jgi:hypothetical protein